ncbi:MAG: c-type cytochrome [Lewinellaceae bacterium]|nr:c-type cytochrome [Lewinellaceae bacterium]
MKIFQAAGILTALVVLLANSRLENNAAVVPDPPPGTTYLEPSPQRSGDAGAGYQYLLYGDFVSSGIPLRVFKRASGGNSPDDLGRTGDAAGIPFRFNVITTANGVKVVAPTCLTCHAEKLNGQLIVGLGSNTMDHTRDAAANFKAADLGVKMMFGENSPEWAAYYPASRATKTMGPYIRTETRGPNPADKIFAVLAAHRSAADFAWIDEAQFNIPAETVPTDVPAWWLMKKKNALYYNGLGRGDFGRLASASGMLTMLDSAEARRIDSRMPDLMAWIRTIEPPKYPYPIDGELAAAGKKIFEKTCYKCHGTYGDSVSYPNLLVSLEKAGTDPLLSNAYKTHPEYHTWYNNSWYGQGANKGQMLPNDGYVAPPLDGVWATAPYLHNASVPTLEDLLNSTQRPVYWKRVFENTEANYDQVKGGWKYTVEPAKTDVETYDTTLPGYGNGGHKFGDRLTAEERKAVVEYLKTL